MQAATFIAVAILLTLGSFVQATEYKITEDVYPTLNTCAGSLVTTITYYTGNCKTTPPISFLFNVTGGSYLSYAVYNNTNCAGAVEHTTICVENQCCGSSIYSWEPYSAASLTAPCMLVMALAYAILSL
jgi:hypothetical protein